MMKKVVIAGSASLPEKVEYLKKYMGKSRILCHGLSIADWQR
jgi:hypothetical protein